MRFEVLDNGYVELIDFMGGDHRAAETARISTMTEGSRDDDAKLVRFLIKMGHGTPFEHSYFTLKIKCPIFVARQWFRHRICSYNEMSMRYCVADRDYYIPPDVTDEQRERYVASCENAYDIYDELRGDELRKEVARGVLPTAMYTQFFWTINARALMNFLHLRLEKSAQSEIRHYGKAILEIFKEKMPATADAFVDLNLGDLKRPPFEMDIEKQ